MTARAGTREATCWDVKNRQIDQMRAPRESNPTVDVDRRHDTVTGSLEMMPSTDNTHVVSQCGLGGQRWASRSRGAVCPGRDRAGRASHRIASQRRRYITPRASHPDLDMDLTGPDPDPGGGGSSFTPAGSSGRRWWEETPGCQSRGPGPRLVPLRLISETRLDDSNRITTRTGTTHARHHAITNRSLEANLEPAPARQSTFEKLRRVCLCVCQFLLRPYHLRNPPDSLSLPLHLSTWQVPFDIPRYSNGLDECRRGPCQTRAATHIPYRTSVRLESWNGPDIPPKTTAWQTPAAATAVVRSAGHRDDDGASRRALSSST
ncbi:hypothetical protein CCHR01_00011 [Colletotrichum chrysophilum]|uniref:Uncharacterized protein n=1 Tax=Colletotrichum chrysophilum TaxID=1836956 RepID=A0AAD9B2M1_9PEZI|nr:hypothetical protein CCHR01_00011 [Colletotrichum chrysophilum]